jgi:hypothetical protein
MELQSNEPIQQRLLSDWRYPMKDSIVEITRNSTYREIKTDLIRLMGRKNRATMSRVDQHIYFCPF